MTTTLRSALPVLALLTAVLTGCADDGDAGSTASPSASGPAGEANSADVEFARQMIPHHQQAVEMAAMVPDSASPELVALADAVEAAQQPEIDELSELLTGWGQELPASGGGHAGHGGADDTMAGMMSAEDLDALAAASGPEFETRWLTMMIEHHEGAIAMSETQLARGSDAAAQGLAQAIVDAQEAEITQLTQLLDDRSAG